MGWIRSFLFLPLVEKNPPHSFGGVTTLKRGQVAIVEPIEAWQSKVYRVVWAVPNAKAEL